MSAPTPAIVYRTVPFTGRQYLYLDGPFAYPTWQSTVSEATIMTPAIASQWAQAYGATSDTLERAMRK